MSALLKLPAEILDAILGYALLHEQRPPASVDEARHSRLGVNPEAEAGCQDVVYGNFTTASNAAPLLRVNRKLSAHTRGAIARLFPEGARYKLDVMIVDERQLWPTWLHVPYLTEHIQAVEVTFRVFGVCPDDGSAFRMHWMTRQPLFTACCYSLLSHFLEAGPYPSTSSRSLEVQRSHHITVKTMDLRFRAGDPACLPPNESQETHALWREFQRASEPGQFAIHPAWLAEGVSRRLQLLPRVFSHEGMARLLHSRIGQYWIRPPPDSEMSEVKVDLHEILGALFVLPYNSQFDCELRSFWNWKWNTIQERRKHGLGVPDNAEWPSLETWLEWTQIWQEGSCSPSACLCFETGLEDWLRSQAVKK